MNQIILGMKEGPISFRDCLTLDTSTICGSEISRRSLGWTVDPGVWCLLVTPVGEQVFCEKVNMNPKSGLGTQKKRIVARASQNVITRKRIHLGTVRTQRPTLRRLDCGMETP